MATYPKPFMKVPELISMGKSRESIINDIHSAAGHTFARKIGKGAGTHWLIDTEAYAKYEAKKMKLDAGRRR